RSTQNGRRRLPRDARLLRPEHHLKPRARGSSQRASTGEEASGGGGETVGAQRTRRRQRGGAAPRCASCSPLRRYSKATMEDPSKSLESAPDSPVHRPRRRAMPGAHRRAAARAKEYSTLLAWLHDLGAYDVFPEAVFLEMGRDRGGIRLADIASDVETRENLPCRTRCARLHREPDACCRLLHGGATTRGRDWHVSSPRRPRSVLVNGN